MTKTIQCATCEQYVSHADYVDSQWICGYCSGKTDMCRCGSHNVVFSDYGVDLCPDCLVNSTPAQKQWINEQAYNEALDSGRI